MIGEKESNRNKEREKARNEREQNDEIEIERKACQLVIEKYMFILNINVKKL